MQKHIQLPSNFWIGKNALENLEKYKEKNTLVVTGPTTRKVAGDKAAEILETDTLIVEEPTTKEAERVEKEIKENDKDIAIAVGGGKVIDLTKSGSYRAGKKFISIPTTLANDGIASQMASLQENGTRESKKAETPETVIVDSGIIKNCPYELIRGGVGDTLSNLTAVKDWKLGHILKDEYYGDYSSSLTKMVGELVKKRAKSIQERSKTGLSTLTEALISSGAAMGIAGSSRPASGSANKFSHTLDKIADKSALHGEQCGVGAIAMSYLQGENWREIKNALKDADAPTTGEELGVQDEVMIEAMVKAKQIKPKRYTIIEHIGINREIAENALKKTEII